MDVQLLFFGSCPNYVATLALLEDLQEHFDFGLRTREIITIEEAQEVGFLGSPSVRVDNRDILLIGTEQVGLSCRLYLDDATVKGTPSRSQLHEALTQLMA